MTEIKDGKPTPTVYQGGIKLEEVTKAADGLGKYRELSGLVISC